MTDILFFVGINQGDKRVLVHRAVSASKEGVV